MIKEYFTDIPSRSAIVPATVVLPEGATAFVVLAHGFCGARDENGGFSEIARLLALGGVASIRPDFAGCGKSTDSFSNNTLANCCADVVSCCGYMRELGIERFGLLGNSLGSRVVMQLINGGFRCRAVCLFSPAAACRGMFNIFGGEENFLRTWNEAKKTGSVPYRTFNGDMVPMAAELFREMYENDTIGEAKPNGIPTLVVYAEDDDVVPPEISKRVAVNYGCELLEISGGGHTLGMYNERRDVAGRAERAAADFFIDKLK